ncbi:hypothetical protein [Streptomyces sp. 1222.5]|uniref:hypothetical protein n=1 Tax=Streptomyces sp. 1222.5 TaxID=1881026 RepID=UPI003D719701
MTQPATDPELRRQLADVVEALGRSESELVAMRQRAAHAEAALACAREIASELFMAGRTETEREIGRRLSTALDQPANPCPTGAHHAHPMQTCTEYETWRHTIDAAIKETK